jgi:hypothetical protein
LDISERQLDSILSALPVPVIRSNLLPVKSPANTHQLVVTTVLLPQHHHNQQTQQDFSNNHGQQLLHLHLLAHTVGVVHMASRPGAGHCLDLVTAI